MDMLPQLILTHQHTPMLHSFNLRMYSRHTVTAAESASGLDTVTTVATVVIMAATVATTVVIVGTMAAITVGITVAMVDTTAAVMAVITAAITETMELQPIYCGSLGSASFTCRVFRLATEADARTGWLRLHGAS